MREIGQNEIGLSITGHDTKVTQTSGISKKPDFQGLAGNATVFAKPRTRCCVAERKMTPASASR